MKAAFVLSILCAWGGVSFGQTPAAEYAPPGIAIVKYSAHPMPPKRDWDTLGSASAENQSMGDLRTLSRGPQLNSLPTPAVIAPSVSGRERTSEIGQTRSGDSPGFDVLNPASSTTGNLDRPIYEYAAHIKNVGDKTVMALVWEYRFIEPETGAQIDARKFKSVRRLLPGKSLTLNAASYGPRVVSAAVHDKKRKQFDERVVIRCLVYSDGQVFAVGSSSGTDCNNLTTH